MKILNFFFWRDFLYISKICNFEFNSFTMKNFLLYLFTFCLSLPSFSQSKDYYLLNGTIDKYPINMILSMMTDDDNSKSFHAYYSYESQDIPIFLYQEKMKGDNLKMIHGGDENTQEIFNGTFQNGTYKGTWVKGKKNLKFELKESSSANSTEIIHLTNKKIVPIKLKSGTEIQGTYTYDWYLPKDLNFQKELLKMIDPSYADFQSYTNKALAIFEYEYKDEIQENLKSFSEEELKTFSPMSWNYTYYEYFQPLLDNKNYLVMNHSGYQYTGGAHGISYQNHFTYDKRKKKWLALFDVLDMDQIGNITEVLDKSIRQKYNLAKDVGLSQGENSIFINDHIHVSDDFTLSKKGITFHYGLYDMTPYAHGYFDHFVSYEDLKPYLQKGFSY